MAAVKTKKKLMTAEQFFEWVHRPENQARDYELVRGEVVEVSRPGDRHCHVCGNGVFVLNLFARKRRRGRVLANDPGIILERDPDTVRGPDIAFFDEVKSYAEISPKLAEDMPKLAVEILSPNDRIGKVTQRINEFLQSGVCLVWLVDPEDRNVTVYRADRPSRVVEEDGELTGEEFLPDLRIRVAEFFYSPGAEEVPPAKSPGKRRRKQ